MADSPAAVYCHEYDAKRDITDTSAGASSGGGGAPGLNESSARSGCKQRSQTSTKRRARPSASGRRPSTQPHRTSWPSATRYASLNSSVSRGPQSRRSAVCRLPACVRTSRGRKVPPAPRSRRFDDFSPYVIPATRTETADPLTARSLRPKRRTLSGAAVPAPHSVAPSLGIAVR